MDEGKNNVKLQVQKIEQAMAEGFVDALKKENLSTILPEGEDVNIEEEISDLEQ